MGDRAQLAVRHGDKMVWLYTHYDGSKIYTTLARALRRGQSRWGDCEYLTRIIFSEMVRDDWVAATGFGIGTSMHGDLEHHVPVVDGDTQTIDWFKAPYCSESVPESISFETFIMNHLGEEA